MSVPFTQYLRPDGRKRAVTIDVPEEVEKIALDFIESGGRYECEELSTGIVSLTAVKHGDDMAIQLCRNGPEVPSAVERLIMRSKRFIHEAGTTADNRGDDDRGT